jgi:transcriptional regulator with XRE-family HTH domain
MKETAPADLNQRIAQRVRDLRAARGLSLEAVATQSGVSRSMISLIERGESSPTAVVLERLATGLGVALASLFDAPEPHASPLARAREQPPWRDPQSGYVRRNVSPAGAGSPIQIVEVTFPPGARVAYETGRASRVCTSRSGCTKARSTSPSAPSAIDCRPAIAWRSCSTGRCCITTRRASRRATQWCCAASLC